MRCERESFGGLIPRMERETASFCRVIRRMDWETASFSRLLRLLHRETRRVYLFHVDGHSEIGRWREFHVGGHSEISRVCLFHVGGHSEISCGRGKDVYALRGTKREQGRKSVVTLPPAESRWLPSASGCTPDRLTSVIVTLGPRITSSGFLHELPVWKLGGRSGDLR